MDAVLCKHCRSTLEPEAPSHRGTCPYCKESIHPEAVICRHCLSRVGPEKDGCSCRQQHVPAARQRTASGDEIRLIPRRASDHFRTGHVAHPYPRPRDEPQGMWARKDCDGCADMYLDAEGAWCLIECSEHYCIVQLCSTL